MIVLSCNEIYKSFGIESILENISFTISTGDKIGLVGSNGAGKSTLFKIITGIYPYDKGELYLSKNINLGYLEQNNNFDSSHTIFEEVLKVFSHLIELEEELRNLEIQISKESTSSESLNKLMDLYAHKSEEFQNQNGYGYKSEIRGVLRGLGFSEDEFHMSIHHLSGGQKTRVALAKLLLKKPDILLLDEPTNHLDMDAIEWLEGFLKSYKGSIILISHDRYFLDQIVEKIYEIENKFLTPYTGNYSFYVKKKKENYEQQKKAYLAQQKEIQKQEEMIRKFKQHGTEKLAKRAKSREKRLEHISMLEKPVFLEEKAKIRFETQIKSGEDVLFVENLSKSFGENQLFRNVSFSIYRGERVGLIGPNGIGKSTLFKMLLEKIPYEEGIVKLGHHVNMGYFDQEQSDLNLSNKIIDEIWEQNTSFTQTQVRTILGSFLFQGEDVFKEIATLSGGEKSRVSLLKLMLSKANFLLIDEPTNHLDIASKEALEEALKSYDGTLLVISHDRYFLNQVATKILDLSSEGIKEYLGNYEYYHEKKNESIEYSEETQPQKTKTQLKDEKKKEKEKQKEEKRIKKEQEALEEKILIIEEKIKQLEHEMCKEEIYTNPEESKKIHEKTNEFKKELEILYEKWEYYLE
ncbi:ribosomal protection-like ABC-F family protein [Inediibacterium massiliense]|uniref:ribosomal protection-like ABC-F family protein n=1 Tax=Inediibacterium massiliense TaxID=1658111 RepID=UPI0006B4708D|nr:ABC-F family ATP-binding cassette domain-containing protein [Inediibacterium massiliense]